jgi:hypothetical protein
LIKFVSAEGPAKREVPVSAMAMQPPWQYVLLPTAMLLRGGRRGDSRMEVRGRKDR